MKKKVKILHIVPAFTYGIASYVKGLIEGADADKVQFDVMGFGEVPDEFRSLVESKGGKCISLPSIHREPKKMVALLADSIKTGKYDVMHCHVYGYRGVVFKALGKRYGIKHIIIHAHASDEENKSKFHKLQTSLNRICNVSFANHYFTCSTIAAEYQYGKNFCGKHKIVTMPNSVKTEKFCIDIDSVEKEKYYRELKISEENFVLIHVGRFYNQKNHSFLIDIVKAVKKDCPNVVALLVGTGELQDNIKKKVEKNYLQNNIRFLNERADVNKLLQLADVFVLPSFFEGLPVVGIEAQAAGLPLLVADTVTTEVDMDMGLVEFLPIDNSVEIWKTAILNKGKNRNRTTPHNRKLALQKKGFTTVGLWEKYYKEVLEFIGDTNE